MKERAAANRNRARNDTVNQRVLNAITKQVTVDLPGPRWTQHSQCASDPLRLYKTACVAPLKHATFVALSCVPVRLNDEKVGFTYSFTYFLLIIILNTASLGVCRRFAFNPARFSRRGLFLLHWVWPDVSSPINFQGREKSASSFYHPGFFCEKSKCGGTFAATVNSFHFYPSPLREKGDFL